MSMQIYCHLLWYLAFFAFYDLMRRKKKIAEKGPSSRHEAKAAMAVGAVSVQGPRVQSSFTVLSAVLPRAPSRCIQLY